MISATIFIAVLYITLMNICVVSSDCISKSQQKELQYCCEMEELIPRDVRTKCQERAAVHHNPGFPMYDRCQKQCIFEELGVINGNELQLEALYPLAERFPVDYREAVRLAIDECNSILQNIRKSKTKREEQCSMLGQQVERCLHASTYSNCPVSRWKSSTACNKVRQRVPYC